MEKIMTQAVIDNSPQTPTEEKTPKLNKVALVMIVKNEARKANDEGLTVIERCLGSVLPCIDTFVICDTGSTDGTQEVIKSWAEKVGIDGHVIDREWKDFGTNRSEALEYARELTDADYCLMIDADEILVYDQNFDPINWRKSLTADLYNVFAEYGGTRYHRPQLTSNHKRFYYRGVLHEYVDCHDETSSREFCPGFINTPIQDGARSDDPEKYAKDAITFEKALAEGVDEQDVNRYLFYLAQSYRDSQQWEKCLDAYQKRADAGGWTEEVYYSLFQVARTKEILLEKGKYNIDEVIEGYMKAFQQNPWRSEALWAASRFCRLKCRFDQAFCFANHAVRLPLPEGALFVTKAVYDFMVLDEYAISCYWTGRYKESRDACVELLRNPNLPEEYKERVNANLEHSIEALKTR
jgi:glycosyltransferase involved in cell wall biosynthesis